MSNCFLMFALCISASVYMLVWRCQRGATVYKELLSQLSVEGFIGAVSHFQVSPSPFPTVSPIPLGIELMCSAIPPVPVDWFIELLISPYRLCVSCYLVTIFTVWHLSGFVALARFITIAMFINTSCNSTLNVPTTRSDFQNSLTSNLSVILKWKAVQSQCCIIKADICIDPIVKVFSQWQQEAQTESAEQILKELPVMS